MPDRGLAALAEIPEQAVYSSEIYRCRGELLLGQGHAHMPEAENCIRTAVELARRGGRRSLELRAATSLSRLLQRQGKPEDARHTLAEIYSCSTEGFDTADLRGAKTLLDELSTASR
jgi:predicted ATPase